MNGTTAVLLGGPCDLTRMAVPDMVMRDGILRVPALHTSTVTFGYQRESQPNHFTVHRYQRTSHLRHSATEVFEWVGTE